MEQVTVFAPGSASNLGPGFDCLGVALSGRGDRVTARRSKRAGVRVVEVSDPRIPLQPERNTAALAATAVLRLAGASQEGVELSIEKGLALAAGLGGSAASAVAGAVAADALLGCGLSRNALFEAALEAETVVAGRHGDNVAPSLLGGAVLVVGLDPPRLGAIRVHPSIRLVLTTPDYRSPRPRRRAVLPAQVARADAVAQASHLAALLFGLERGDPTLIRGSLVDHIAEPARASLYPGYAAARAAGLEAGALGVAVSGAGPTLVALVEAERAEAVAAGARGGLRGRVHRAESHIAEVDPVGARISSVTAYPVCASCAVRLPARSPRTTCTCGGLLEVVQEPGLRGATIRRRFDRRITGDAVGQGSGVWRFRELLLATRDRLVSQPEGNTRLYRREAISAYAGVADLTFKHEGENPTGSFKDRGMTVAVSQALRTGASGGRLRLDRQHLGLDGRLRRAGGAAGARLRARGQGRGRASWPRRSRTARTTLLVRGDFDACLRLVREASEALRRHAAQLGEPLADRGPEDDRARAAPAARLAAAGLDRRAGRQPGQHRGLRQGAARGARLRADRQRAAPGRDPGLGREPLLSRLPRRLSAPLPGAGRDRRHGDPHRRPRQLRPRRARHPGHPRRRRCRQRRGDPARPRR